MSQNYTIFRDEGFKRIFGFLKDDQFANWNSKCLNESYKGWNEGGFLITGRIVKCLPAKKRQGNCCKILVMLIIVIIGAPLMATQ